MINWSLSISKIARLLILSFMSGIVVADFFRLDIFIIFCVILFLIFGLFIGWSNMRQRVTILILIFFLVGFWRFQISLPDFSNHNNIYYYNTQQVVFTGFTGSVNKKNDYQELIINLKIDQSNSIGGKVVLMAPLFPEYRYGDILKISCKLKSPDKINDFDYGRYLFRFNIYTICVYPKITATGLSQNDYKFKIFSVVYFVKSKLSQSLDIFVTEPEASLLQAMMLNITGGFPKNLKTIFANVGLSHVIAISGMHIVMLTVIISQLAIALGIVRQKSFWVALIGVTFYVAMIGFPPSAVRGAIMALLFLYAQKIGRLSYSLNALLVSAFFMLNINPKLLLYDIGFQLSFMAVLGLLYLLPILKIKLKYWPELGQLKNILITTLAAQIMTQPLIIFYFSNFSIVSILANLLVLPLVPLMMIWVFINLIIGLGSISVGSLMGYVSYLLVHYMIVMATFLNNLPLAYLNLEINSLPLTIIFYLVIIVFIYKNKFFLS